MDADTYDLCIIGAGLIGSAAARHASANVNVKVCLIGRSEPKPNEHTLSEVPVINDEAVQIVTVLDNIPEGHVLSKHSIESYKELEELSGTNFYNPVGCLFVGRKNRSFMTGIQEKAATYDVPVLDFPDQVAITDRYPCIKLEKNEHAVLDDNGAGHINPKRLVTAQKKMATLQGCVIIDDLVHTIDISPSGVYKVETENKGSIMAKRLLIATSRFVNSEKIFKPLKVKKSSVNEFLLGIPEEKAEQLRSLPSLVIYREYCKYVKNFLCEAYALPPIKYPDGKYYLEFGETSSIKEDIGSYFWPEEHSKPLTILQNLLSGLKNYSVGTKPVTIHSTNSGLPYIDRISPTVTVAFPANRKGAKSSDEVGRIAAQLSICGQWDSELPQSAFKAVFQ